MVDKNVVTPLHVQVTNELRKEILAKNYGENGCIGTHTQLAERFGVSLRTIRTAVQQLSDEGLVDIRQGKGTFVRRTMFVDPLKDLTGISNMLSQMQVDRESVVPVLEHIETPAWIAQSIRQQLGETCVFIRRNVIVDGVPTANADMYLPGKYQGFFDHKELETLTVYQVYQQKLGVALGRGRQIIRAAGASKSAAESLGLPEGSPVLQIERQAFSAEGELIEYMILTYEASKYCFEVELELNKPW